MSLIAALDVGTTTVRAAVFDGKERLGIARQGVRAAYPFSGAVEQDPAEIVGSARDVLQHSVRSSGLTVADVDGLAITNQRASVLAWDSETSEPLSPLISWQDTRTAARVAEFVALGFPLNTSASCTKLEWLLANSETVATAAAGKTLRFGTVDTWLTWVLSGGTVYVTDPSNAGATGFYDSFSGGWSEEIMAVLGIPLEAMPALVASDAPVGTCDPSVVGAPLALKARCGDQSAASMTHGLGAGQAKLTLGTSGMLDVGCGSTISDAPSGCYTLPLWRRTVDGKLVEEYMVEGSILAAGSVIEWLVRVGLLASVDQLDAVAASAAASAASSSSASSSASGSASGGVEFVPSLAGLGSPHQNPQVRGVLSGIGLQTTAADIVWAAVNGLAERVAELTSHMNVDGPLLVDGGLSQSQLLLEQIRQATDLEIRASADHETALRGAALLAQSS